MLITTQRLLEHMNQSTEIELAGQGTVERLPDPGLSIEQAFQAVVAGTIKAEHVAVMRELLAMDAERKFAAAFVALQAEMPKIQATKAVPNNDGTVRYRFAPFEDLMEQIAPMLQKHGFTVSFSSRIDDKRIISTCTLQHSAGHKRSNDFAVRVGQGPPKATETQSDGAAATYAKRFALTEALNIVVAHMDNDARLEGSAVTPEVADELERRVKLTNSNVDAFLKLAGAKKFSEISSIKYDMLDQLLRRKEKAGR